MTRQSFARQVIYFLLGSVINLGFFVLTKYTAFPIWADYTGSILITALCNPLLGIVSALIHTILLIVLIDGWCALLPFIPVITVCVIVKTCLKTDLNSLRQLSAYSFYSVVSVFICNAIIFLCSPSVAGRYTQFSDVFMTLRQVFGRFFGSVIFSAAISLPEILLTLMVFWVLYIVLPKKTDRLVFKK